MSEMVERAARASFAWWAKANRRTCVFEDMPEWEKDAALEHVRAVIEAMREPTDAMVGPEMQAVCGEPATGVRYIWQRLIDEALK